VKSCFILCIIGWLDEQVSFQKEYFINMSLFKTCIHVARCAKQTCTKKTQRSVYCWLKWTGYVDDTMLTSVLQPHTNALPNCFQLHKDMQVSWEIFGPQITIQLAGQVGEYHAVILKVPQG